MGQIVSFRQKWLWAAVMGLRDAGLSQREVGEVLGITQGRVSQLYNSRVANEFRQTGRSRPPAGRSQAEDEIETRVEAARAEANAKFRAKWSKARQIVVEQAETIEDLTAERDRALADVARLERDLEAGTARAAARGE